MGLVVAGLSIRGEAEPSGDSLSTDSRTHAADFIRRVQAGPHARLDFVEILVGALTATDSSDPTYADFINDFYEEVSQVVEKLDAFVAGYRRGETPTVANIQEAFRLAHMIKGAAATMGYHFIAQIARGLEDLLDEIKKGHLALDDLAISVVEEGTAIIAQSIEECKAANRVASQA